MNNHIQNILESSLYAMRENGEITQEDVKDITQLIRERKTKLKPEHPVTGNLQPKVEYDYSDLRMKQVN